MKPSSLYQHEVDSGAITPDSAQIAALEHLDLLFDQVNLARDQSWFKRLIRKAQPTGLYMWGGVGTGKTLLMDILFQALPEGTARRIHFHRFMQSVHEQKNQVKDQQNPLHIVARTLSHKHRVLCLDEFSVTDITDAMILYGLLNALFDQGVTLVTTSNIPRRDLYKDGLQRSRFVPAIELLEQYTSEIHVDAGNDYRMAFLQNDSIYHTPLGPATEEELKTAFARLAGHFEESKTEIELSGRPVPVIATGSGVVWFKFADLCEGHRSKVDYIELSKRFHTILLSNIPRMDDASNDPARRFIELIDELYDRGVNLIVSAAEQPGALYSGKRLQMPFERTVSRLQEMASIEYLARPHLP